MHLIILFIRARNPRVPPAVNWRAAASPVINHSVPNIFSLFLKAIIFAELINNGWPYLRKKGSHD